MSSAVPSNSRPATQAEQRIAWKQDAAIGDIIGNMPECVAGRVDHPRFGGAEIHRIAFMHGEVELWQSVRIGGVADHHGMVSGDQRRHAVDMVGMVMRQQDHVELAAGRLDRRNRRRGLGGIDDRDLAGDRLPSTTRNSCR